MLHQSDSGPASNAIAIDDGPVDTRGKAPDVRSAPTAPASTSRAPRFAFFRKTKAERGWQCGIAVFDFLLRLLAIGATVAATIVMATADETLPFVTGRYQFYANFSDLPSLTFFVVGNSIAAGYLVFSLPLSIAGIICARATCPRLLLLILDLVMVALTAAAGSAATAIVQLAHTGSEKANWVAICLRFDGFCQQISGSVVASFVGTLILMLMVVMHAIALRKR